MSMTMTRMALFSVGLIESFALVAIQLSRQLVVRNAMEAKEISQIRPSKACRALLPIH